ncbi:hypothetical protein CBR_g52406 [Chara braunii]|uniref:Uncharacterized protein n=1 Tax=Chara braunii TaxID=69332 RepID=A0A388MA49_CHABU|nr:hypothetical protein CBR_g52406 [Chara braunii]|eukprot:GBG91451.1 hypothetical protein CBR_g52406 [Chara braunii]
MDVLEEGQVEGGGYGGDTIVTYVAPTVELRDWLINVQRVEEVQLAEVRGEVSLLPWKSPVELQAAKLAERRRWPWVKVYKPSTLAAKWMRGAVEYFYGPIAEEQAFNEEDREYTQGPLKNPLKITVAVATGPYKQQPEIREAGEQGGSSCRQGRHVGGESQAEEGKGGRGAATVQGEEGGVADLRSSLAVDGGGEGPKGSRTGCRGSVRTDSLSKAPDRGREEVEEGNTNKTKEMDCMGIDNGEEGQEDTQRPTMQDMGTGGEQWKTGIAKLEQVDAQGWQVYDPPIIMDRDKHGSLPKGARGRRELMTEGPFKGSSSAECLPVPTYSSAMAESSGTHTRQQRLKQGTTSHNTRERERNPMGGKGLGPRYWLRGRRDVLSSPSTSLIPRDASYGLSVVRMPRGREDDDSSTSPGTDSSETEHSGTQREEDQDENESELDSGKDQEEGQQSDQSSSSDSTKRGGQQSKQQEEISGAKSMRGAEEKHDSQRQQRERQEAIPWD